MHLLDARSVNARRRIHPRVGAELGITEAEQSATPASPAAGPASSAHPPPEIIMQAKTLIAAAVLGIAGNAAFAQEAGSDAWMAIASTRTVAEVQAELRQARASGEIAAIGREAHDFSAASAPSVVRLVTSAR
jgi:hypothetical protein